ncbi:TetR/AcrR family transcriptional regulator [Actinoplanes sp. N902-109]|uniref:TetR/AcrR family transcriptional regulator n=1 Tax=Actinoplanes sp. (strain N902-109) TaxID=649831 RepID=UPI0003293B6C|nr:TetR/AcrR family transcriptional regulator C-terminal domain-containing protein [Actinoplanes sp. N902-109]AGL14191.1 TetR family transcriptional regulator [Actinoplanes sp. N902-109]
MRITLALLWRDESAIPRKGPRRGLTLDHVITAALRIADRDGLAALTIRRVAEAIGTAPMSVYTHVPGKAELVDLMVDLVYAHMPRTDTTGRPWRDRLTAVAEDNRVLLRDHPWLTAVPAQRPVLGPGAIGKYEHELTALDGLGLTDVQMDDCLTHLLTFVTASARAALEAQAVAETTALTDEQWWADAGPLLARFLNPADYPLATRVGTAAGTAHRAAHDPGHSYDFGLRRVLDGLAPLIEPPGAPTP